MQKYNQYIPRISSGLRRSIVAALSMAGVVHTAPTQASLTSSSVLSFDPGIIACILNDCSLGTNVVGSWFSMDATGDSNIQSFEKVPITRHDGIRIGFASTATGSHTAPPFGAANNYTSESSGITEHPGVDEPWGYFGSTGMHFLSSPVTVLSDEGSKKFLDLSGWTVTWNGIPAITMDSGAWNFGTNFFNGGNGVARITCSTSSCSTTSTFVLDYFATVPRDGKTSFGGVQYSLHLEGQISEAVVPVPAAAWLFGSGLLGLAGVARRNHARK